MAQGAFLSQKMTVESWGELPEESRGELVNGLLVEEEVPSFAHELVVAWFVRMMGNWGSSLGVLVAGSGIKLALSAHHGRMADAVVYLPGARRPEPRGAVTVAPCIALEVLSPTPRDARRDRVEKLSEYAAFGVSYYWLIDPDLRTLEILELAFGRYVHVLSLGEGSSAAVPGCAGLVLDVDGLWRELDAFMSASE